MAGRKIFLLAVLFAFGLSTYSSSAIAQECEWCDRLAEYIKVYTYLRKKEDAKIPRQDREILGVERIEYKAFEVRPRTRELRENTPQDSDVETVKSGETNDHFYFVCENHRRIEESLAFARAKDSFGKVFDSRSTAGRWYYAQEAADSSSETRVEFELTEDPQDPIMYVVEIVHSGLTKATIEENLRDVLRPVTDDPAFSEVKSKTEKDYREGNQASFRVLAYDLSTNAAGREVVPITEIEEISKEYSVREGGGTPLRIRFERDWRQAEESTVLPENVRERREKEHYFDAGDRWVIRNNPDPLRRLLPRDEFYTEVMTTENPAEVRFTLAIAMDKYLSQLLTEYDALMEQRDEFKPADAETWAASDESWQRYHGIRSQLSVKASEIEDLRAHIDDVDDITYCIIQPSIPAVRIWEDYTDPLKPRTIAISPWNGGFKEYKARHMWGYLTPYLAVIAVLLISSVLSIFGIKSGGG